MGTDDKVKATAARPYVDGPDNARAADCLVKAFKDDPLFHYLFNGYAYERALRRFFSWSLWAMAGAARSNDYAPPMEVIEHPTTKEVLCFAGWGPSTSASTTLVGYMRALCVLVVMAVLEGPFLLPRLLEIAYIFQFKRKAYAPTAHHLKFIGTTSSVQGNGLGARLLKVGIDRATRAKVPCYLESSNPRNVSFYKKHGFRVVEAWRPLAQPRFHIEGPLVTLMVRDMEEKAGSSEQSQKKNIKKKDE